MARLEALLGPEAVAEALRSGRRVVEVHVAEGAEDGEAARLARGEGVPVRVVPVERLQKEAGGRDAQGILAYVKAEGYVLWSEPLAAAQALGQVPLLVAVDQTEDEEAVGTLLRTLATGEVHGLLLPTRGAGVTPEVARRAGAALDRVKVARPSNLAQVLGRLADAGLRVVGLDREGEAVASVDLTGPLVLVLPPEGHRLSSEVADACHARVASPITDPAGDLPLAVHAGLLLYERRRQSGLARPPAAPLGPAA